MGSQTSPYQAALALVSFPLASYLHHWNEERLACPATLHTPLLPRHCFLSVRLMNSLTRKAVALERASVATTGEEVVDNLAAGRLALSAPPEKLHRGAATAS